MRKSRIVIFLGVLIISAGIIFYNTTLDKDSRWIEVELDMDRLNNIQEQVDEGHMVDWLKPQGGAMNFAYQHLQLKSMNIESVENHDNESTVLMSTSKGKLEMKLKQPVKTDFGIWTVYTYRWRNYK